MIPNDGISSVFSDSSQDQRQAHENNAALQAFAATLPDDIKNANAEIVRRYKATRASDESLESILASATRIVPLPHSDGQSANKIMELDGYQSLQALCEQNNRNIHVALLPVEEGGNQFAAVITYKTDIMTPSQSLSIAMRSSMRAAA